MQIRKFYATEDEFKHFHVNIKLLLCPHCRRVGFLILHGYLYGYGETDLIQRGRRIFCSNRKNRPGCGRTFSFLLAGYIRNFVIFARFLSGFLEHLSQGLCPAEAARKAEIPMTITTIYRLYKRFRHNQARIRTYLTRVKDPPLLDDTTDPVIQTITHLKTVFKDCIVTQFQLHFQTTFLK